MGALGVDFRDLGRLLAALESLCIFVMFYSAKNPANFRTVGAQKWKGRGFFGLLTDFFGGGGVREEEFSFISSKEILEGRSAHNGGELKNRSEITRCKQDRRQDL